MGVLQRMFSRTARRTEHKSFAEFPARTMADEEASDVSNIVILNSLTHDQLLDLLKASHLAPKVFIRSSYLTDPICVDDCDPGRAHC